MRTPHFRPCCLLCAPLPPRISHPATLAAHARLFVRALALPGAVALSLCPANFARNQPHAPTHPRLFPTPRRCSHCLSTHRTCAGSIHMIDLVSSRSRASQHALVDVAQRARCKQSRVHNFLSQKALDAAAQAQQAPWERYNPARSWICLRCVYCVVRGGKRSVWSLVHGGGVRLSGAAQVHGESPRFAGRPSGPGRRARRH